MSNYTLKREVALRHNLNRVVNFVQSNCRARISIEHMADIACLSKFHFTRVFQNYLLETPYQYLHRTRLEYAARSLIYKPDQLITDVAMNCGFTDGSAFSNAFRQRFQFSPKSYRSDKNRLVDSLMGDEMRLEGLTSKSVHIIEKPCMRLAYVRSFGPYEGNNISISIAMGKIVDWAKERGLWSTSTVYIGLCPSNPALSPPEMCIYDACILIPEEIEEDEIVSIQTIPAGRYAVLSVQFSPIQKQAWNWLGSEWLPDSGETYAFENSYEARYGNVMPQGVELCLRLVSK